MSRSVAILWVVALAAVWAVAPAAAQQEPQSSCVTCHSDPDLFEGADLEIAHQVAGGAHAAAGLSCHDCHGGNPDPALADDMFASMDEGFAAHPYVGAPERGEIPAFCGRCHSDPATMRRHAPDLRTDQEQEYWSSHHGEQLRAGNPRVATCIDCHGVHGILKVDDPEAPTHPRRVAETCGACHSDAERMESSTLADGRPLPIDQLALWRQSVHAKALLDKEDLFAPTCNDCHGNHGAAPPGLDSLAFVCGQCHGREAELFRASNKHDLLQEHQELSAGETCNECHEAPEPQAALVGHVSFGECDTCHGHHAVLRPTLAMLAPLPETPCAFCHEKANDETAAPIDLAASGRRYQDIRDGLLATLPVNLDAEHRFDWMVDRALELPTHSVVDENGESRRRPEFGRLFDKFRIGKTHFQYDDPVTGEIAERQVIRCSQCHGSDTGDGESKGAATAASILRGMRELTALTASAERRVLRARRGGVQTLGAQAAIDQAVDSQIELEVLVHSFSAADDSPFRAKHQQGVVYAQQAITAGDVAIAELSSRRTGLWVSLGFIALLLVGLALKIREIS